jgi:hypothetical protein
VATTNSANSWQKAGVIIQIIVGGLVASALWWAVESNSAALRTSNDILTNATRPAYLIMDVDSGTSGSSFEANGEYRVGGAPGGAFHRAIVSIWNTGARVAENVTISIRFAPENSNITIWDTHTITKCRVDFCIPGTEGGNSSRVITVRAIEPGGFYGIIANYSLVLENLEKVEGPVKFYAEVKNDSTNEILNEEYEVYFGRRD